MQQLRHQQLFREDIRDLFVLTIDPETARDFDDAISLTKNEYDHWRLGVHIADVSHFIPLDSELDKEAILYIFPKELMTLPCGMM